MPAVMALLVSVSYTIIGAFEPAFASSPELVAVVVIAVVVFLAWHRREIS